ncbi:hypothetical protein NE237_008329 [Protea cynaroides]|uniref:Uncharacterized protein n=1 Tax=Protea cynaroides TaxID=273540 RepID=A0A9Q0QZK7_9MAGN|nr:hypothetical protein NE237_008329 [Protea cynaroides]
MRRDATPNFSKVKHYLLQPLHTVLSFLFVILTLSHPSLAEHPSILAPASKAKARKNKPPCSFVSVKPDHRLHLVTIATAFSFPTFEQEEAHVEHKRVIEDLKIKGGREKSKLPLTWTTSKENDDNGVAGGIAVGVSMGVEVQLEAKMKLHRPWQRRWRKASSRGRVAGT